MGDWEQLSDRVGSAWVQVGRGIRGVFGSRNERVVTALDPMVQKIASLEAWAKALSQEQMVAKTNEWKEAMREGKTSFEEILPEAFALVREASVRALGMRHFDVQMIGGIVLHQGKIAEMATGE